MKLQGRFVVEAAVLIPYTCIVMLYLCFCTLYTHDCAVAALAAVESGVKELYRDGDSEQQMEEKAVRDLEQKLRERLLLFQFPEIQAEAGPVRMCLKLTGGRVFFIQRDQEREQILYRINPCEVLRRSRWMMK